MRSIFLGLFCSCLLQSFGCTKGLPSIEECEGKKIAILDLSDLASIGNFPKCELHKAVQVNRNNGVVYSTKHEISNASPHMYGTHAAPWFLYEAVKSSQYYTENFDEADLILVYDYCYYVWWLGDIHSYGSGHRDGPGDHLLQAYTTMLQLPQWKKFDGGQFVFYDAHPGFVAGKAAAPVKNLRCVAFRNSISLIVDTPMRNICEGFWLMKKLVITPYAPSLVDVTDPNYYMHQKFVKAAERPILAYSRQKCTPYNEDSFTGKLMRYWFSFVEWGSNKDMDVRCTDSELNSEGHLRFKDMYEKMRSAKFCPAFPGDSASSRRLSEIFLAGCIPIFLGPPYHSMPFGDTVPYAELGVFFDIKNTSMWMENRPREWRLDPIVRASNENEARWWVPDVDIPRSDFIQVNDSSEVEAHLKGMPAYEIEQKLKLMHKYGSRFSFLQRISDPPNAINSLLSAICIKQTLYPAQLAQLQSEFPKELEVSS